MLAESEVYLTPAQLVARHTAFSMPMIRWWLQWRHENGLNSAVRKVGRRLFIDEEKFLRWIDAQNER